MPHILNVDHQSRVVFSTYTGDVTDADVLAQVDKIATLPISADYRELVDLTKVSRIELSPDVISQISAMHGVFGKDSLRVILLADTSHVHTARFAQTFASLNNAAPFKIAFSRQEAAQLLKEGK
jgi:hypothetical protein